LTPGTREEFTAMARFLILLGLAILVIGQLWPYLSQIGLWRLPGDVVIDPIMRLTRTNPSISGRDVTSDANASGTGGVGTFAG
jgi:hypothetical protein